MKLRRIIAATSAAAIAATAVAATASAAFTSGVIDSGSGMFVCLLADDRDDAMYKDTTLVDDITKVTVTISCEKYKDLEDVKADVWNGGGFGFNSNSTGWDQHEWSFQDGVKELTWQVGDKKGTYVLTYDKGAPIFASTDTYAQIWLQDWSNAYDYEIVSFELLNADGVDIRNITVDAPVEETPAETVEAPVEETEEIVEETVVVEETVEIIESVEEPAVETVEEPVDEPAVDTEAPTTGDKQSPDTGVEGIAAVAGIVALAGAAVVASRKRK